MEQIIKGVAGEYAGNYTGPNWSDGKYQESVEWGSADPLSELDYLSRQHDSAYARYKDRAHREAADRIYNEEAKKLAGKFPKIAGNLVLYGNHGEESFGRLYSGFKKGSYAGPVGALGGLVYGALGNMYALHKKLDANYLSKELKEVKEYYATDPRRVELNKRVENLLKPSEPSTETEKPDLEKAERNKRLVENQARKFEKYKNLKEEAEKSAQKQIKNLENANDWNMLGYQGRWRRRMRRNRKTNVIHVSPIR